MSKTVPDAEHRLTSSLIPNYFVWVEIDGEAVPVFSKDQQEKKAVGYIEAIEGKEFTINWADLRTSQPENEFITDVYLDGLFCTGLIWQGEKYSDSLKSTWRHRQALGKEKSTTEVQPFVFGKLQTTDDDDAACTSEAVIKHLGTIRVVYYRITDPREATPEYESPQVEAKPIHEKNKKAKLSHQAIFGQSKVKEPCHQFAFDRIDEEHDPLQVLEFRYRSHGILQLEGHVPDSPQPSPRSSHRSPTLGNDDTERQEEIARLEERLNALKRGSQGGPEAGPSGSKKVKLGAVDASDKKKVKQEKGAGLANKGKKKEILVLSDSD